MKIGINFLPDVSWEQQSGQHYLSEALELCAQADELGLDHVKITEHYLGPYGGYCPSPVVFLAAAAQRTRRTRLITGCVLPIFRHPVLLAAELAMLDCLSGGRLEVGFARAWLPEEFSALGVPLNGSREVFNEHVSAIIRLWTERQVSFTGKAHSFKDVTVYMRPVQQPHPPVWIATTMSPESCTWIGRQGFRIMLTLLTWGISEQNLNLYRQAYEQAGHGKVNPENVILGIPVYVAGTAKRAFAEIEAPFFHSVKILAEAGSQWQTASPTPDYPAYAAASTGLNYNYRYGLPIEQQIENGKLIAGNPEQVYEQLRRLEDRLGISNFSLFFTFGGLPYEKAQRSLDLFGTHVLPRLRRV